MFELPFLMIFHKNNIDLEEIPNFPDFENEISIKYATEYLDLYRELALAINKDDEKQMIFLKPKISKLTSELGRSANKMGENDISKFADWLIKLSNI